MEKAHNLINIKKSKMSNYTSIIDHIFRKHRQYKNQNINSEKTELNTIILDKFGYKNGNFELSEYFKKNKIKTKKFIYNTYSVGYFIWINDLGLENDRRRKIYWKYCRRNKKL